MGISYGPVTPFIAKKKCGCIFWAFFLRAFQAALNEAESLNMFVFQSLRLLIREKQYSFAILARTGLT